MNTHNKFIGKDNPDATTMTGNTGLGGIALKTTQQSAHTGGEWRVSNKPAFDEVGGSPFKKPIFCYGASKPNGSIISHAIGKTIEEAEANAQRIVKAVNMHDELISMLKRELKSLEEWNGNGNYTFRIEEMKDLLKQAEQK